MSNLNTTNAMGQDVIWLDKQYDWVGNYSKGLATVDFGCMPTESFRF